MSAEDPFERFAGIPGTGLVSRAVDAAVRVPSSVIRAHVDQLRRRNPEATPAQLLAILDSELLAVVQTTGGAVGGTAAIPAVGTAVAATLTAADVAAFFAAAAAYTLAVADVHGIEVDDVGRRRTLLLASLLGEDGPRAIESAGLSPTAWARVGLAAMPSTTIQRVNKVLAGRFVKKHLLRRSSLLLGRLVPFGVGAAIGVLGGRALGKGIVAQARAAFGEPPAQFPPRLRVVEGTSADAAPRLEAVADRPGQLGRPDLLGGGDGAGSGPGSSER